MDKKQLPPYILNITILVLALLASVAIGSVFIPPGTLIRILASQLPSANIVPDWPNSFVTIIFKVRLPHTILIALTGAALSGSGAAYQGLFRNRCRFGSRAGHGTGMAK